MAYSSRIRKGLAHFLGGVRAVSTESLGVGAPLSVRVYEVGPRDGLQNEASYVETEKKIKLIDLLSSTGLSHIEASAFVHPKLVPQMADAADVIRGIKRAPGVSYSTLVPNAKGLQRALDAASKAGKTLGEIAIFTSASEEFNERNLNMSISESIKGFEDIMRIAEAENIRVRGYVSVAMGCPYAGDVSADTASRIAKLLVDLGCYEVSLGDTVGLGTPKDVADVVRSCVDNQGIPIEKIALHLHDTRNMAIANAYAGLQEGVRVFDASIAGLGGCPFAATSSNGNLATEDLLYLLHGLGISTGVDFDKVLEVSRYVSESADGLNLTNHSRVARQALGIDK
jgi:hydroxymethylglutaryl-CoA lyase